MKATATRTLQAPQFAPITITLSKKCTEETYDATMDELADAIERKLRERYPQYAGVLPIVQKKVAQPILNAIDKSTYKGLTEPPTPLVRKEEVTAKADKNLNRDEIANNYKQEMLKSKTIEELESWKELAKVYDLIPLFIQQKSKLLNNNTLCTQ